MLARAVAGVGLSPCPFIFFSCSVQGIGSLACFESGQRIGHGCERVARSVPGVGCTGFSIEVEQIFGPLMGVFVARSHIAHVANLEHIAVGHVNNHVVGTAHNTLCLTVLVPVEGHNVPLLVGSGHQVGAAVNPPQALPGKGVAFQVVELGGVGTAANIAAVVALHNELHDAVAVHIA